MLEVRILYGLIICPKFNDVTWLDESNLVNNSRLDMIEKLQEDFSHEYNIHNSSIVPKITKFSKINNFSSGRSEISKIWSLRKRRLYFVQGMMILEFAFNVEFDSFANIEVDNMVKIHNSTLYGNAIHWKKQMCGQFKNDGTLCSTCKTSRVVKLHDMVIVNSKNKAFNYFKNKYLEKQKTNKKHQSFELGKLNWIIIKNHSLIILNREKRQKANTIKGSIIWAISLVAVTQTFGKELLALKAEKVTFSIKKEIDADIIEDLLSYFFFLYYWTNPNFILDKENLRLHMRSLELNSLKFTYDCLSDEKFWEIDNRTITHLTKLPIDIFLELIRKIQELPGGLMKNWLSILNPFRFSIPSFDIYEESLTPQQRKICYEMGKHLLKNVPLRGDLETSDQTILDPMSTNKIGNLLNISAGSQYTKLEKDLQYLVDKGLLKKSDPKKFDMNPIIKAVYYLNPELPYTKAILYRLERGMEGE